MVTFDYPASEHLATLFGGEVVAGEIASYGRTALQSWGKSTMVVGLNIQTHSTWTSENYESILVDVIARQDELVKAGVMGIIYSPVRTSGSSGLGSEGLVKLDGTGVGTKGEKFCAFQKAVERMSAAPPIALFIRTPAADVVNCIKCTSIEKIQGICGMTCENGVDCTLPEGIIGGDYRCPARTVVEPCQLCNETGGTYDCTIGYMNGTVGTISGPMSEVSSDIYMDIVAGIPKPYKCCLQDSLTGDKYTFVKQSFANPLNKPIAFSATGDPNTDCGFGGDTGSVSDLSTFCGIETVSVTDYDINCTIG